MQLAKTLKSARFYSKPAMIVCFGLLGLGVMINASLGHSFLGEQTRMNYKCKTDIRFKGKCPKAVPQRPDYKAKTQAQEATLAFSPFSFDYMH